MEIAPDRAATATRPVQRSAVASRTGVALGALTAVVGFLAVWLTWRIFVTTAEGQRVDQAAMDGAQFGRTRLWQIAEPILEIVSIPALGIVLVATMTVAVLRRRWMLALQIAVLVVGANLSTQLLKYYVLHRPDLDVTYVLANSLPSGHTTAAASVAVAAVLVAPPRARPVATVLGGAYAGLTGVSTLVGQWHRPSDVVAALFVVLAWCGVATAMSALGRRAESRGGRRSDGGTRPDGEQRADGGTRSDGAPRSDRAPRPDRAPRETRPLQPARRFSTSALVVVLGGYLLAAIAGAAAGTALNETRHAVSLDGRTELLTAYAGGALGVLATTGAVFATILIVRTMARPRGYSA